jgi:hypothetical protein
MHCFVSVYLLMPNIVRSLSSSAAALQCFAVGIHALHSVGRWLPGHITLPVALAIHTAPAAAVVLIEWWQLRQTDRYVELTSTTTPGRQVARGCCHSFVLL